MLGREGLRGAEEARHWYWLGTWVTGTLESLVPDPSRPQGGIQSPLLQCPSRPAPVPGQMREAPPPLPTLLPNT
jgi:hypothetical protein